MNLKKNYLVGFLRLLAMLLWVICLPILFWVMKTLKISSYTKVPHIFHHGVCAILGFKRHFTGKLHDVRPTLYVSNHASYLDIFVLGGVPAYFIAKSEVANWPVLGPMSRFQNTIFIERKAGKAREQLSILKNHLQDNNSLTLFPEGTSTNGTHVESFKSSLFEAANSKADGAQRVAIQPVTVAYTDYNGQKITEQSVRDNYAWYGKMPFAPHFFNLFLLKKVDVKVHFHQVCYLDEFESRKQCADHCHALVESKLAEFVN